MNYFSRKDGKNGFALLYAVMVTSVLLSIGLSISNIAYKELVLSSVVRESQIAFYAADTALECALYADVHIGNVFPDPTGVGSLNATPNCNAVSQNSNTTFGSGPVSITKIKPSDTSKLCFAYTVTKAIIDLDGGSTATSTSIDARGYNTCDLNSRRVERGINVTYFR